MDYRNIVWKKENYISFIDSLKAEADLEYKEFHSRLVPDYDSERIIGIRLPVMRKICKEISKGDIYGYLNCCDTYYYEEVMMRGILVGLVKVKDYQEFLSLVESQIKYINNWALCDSFCSGLKKNLKYRDVFLKDIEKYLQDKNPWKIRVGLLLLLDYFLDEKYIEKSLKLCDSITNKHYYVSMAQAWLVATAFAKNEVVAMEYFKNCNLDDITVNRTIQKARDSFRVSKETKETLKNMKRTIDK